LSAFATEQSNKRTNVGSLNTELEQKKQRLEAAQLKYKNTEKKRNMEESAEFSLMEANKKSEKKHKKAEFALNEVDKSIKNLKNLYFNKSQELLKLREVQANLIGEISGTLSARRNLDAKLKKLKQERERQEEVLYNADYSIQQMNR
jgi:coiled-coil domain-containing protein 39